MLDIPARGLSAGRCISPLGAPFQKLVLHISPPGGSFALCPYSSFTREFSAFTSPHLQGVTLRTPQELAGVGQPLHNACTALCLLRGGVPPPDLHCCFREDIACCTGVTGSFLGLSVGTLLCDLDEMCLQMLTE